MKQIKTRETSLLLLEDLAAGVLTKKQLVTKYNYSSVNSLNASIYWFKKRGMFSNEDQKVTNVNIDKDSTFKQRKMKNRIFLTKVEKIAILKDYTTGNYSLRDISRKYNFSVSAIHQLIKKYKENNIDIDESKTPEIIVPETIIKTKRKYNKRTHNDASDSKTVVKSLRTINFPDGFVIQIEKQFISGVLIHENGNITIIK